MGSASVIWATQDIDGMIAYLARVSNAKAKPEDPSVRLLMYLVTNKHWSPLEMANICIEVETTRDIGRQMLRHRSLHFQEFSQRYAEVEQTEPVIAEARLQDTKNRQNSIQTDDPVLNEQFAFWQNKVWDVCWLAYKTCLKMGIAKELCRKLLPEGLTGTRMYVNGTVRDWYHYLEVRLWGPGVQLEHRELAQEIFNACYKVAPETFGTLLHDGG
jgi:thymidylate synthase (FAD)